MADRKKTEAKPKGKAVKPDKPGETIKPEKPAEVFEPGDWEPGVVDEMDAPDKKDEASEGTDKGIPPNAPTKDEVVELITKRYIGYLPIGSIIKLPKAEAEQYIKDGLAARRVK